MLLSVIKYNPFIFILPDFPKNVSSTERLSNNYFSIFQRFNWKVQKAVRNLSSPGGPTKEMLTESLPLDHRANNPDCGRCLSQPVWHSNQRLTQRLAWGQSMGGEGKRQRMWKEGKSIKDVLSWPSQGHSLTLTPAVALGKSCELHSELSSRWYKATSRLCMLSAKQGPTSMCYIR